MKFINKLKKHCNLNKVTLKLLALFERLTRNNYVVFNIYKIERCCVLEVFMFLETPFHIMTRI